MARRRRATRAHGRARTRGPVYRDGMVHVMAQQCGTCIFRPGNALQLHPEMVPAMLVKTERQQGSIPCHETLLGLQAICRGFWELRQRDGKIPALQIAARLGLATYDGAPTDPTAWAPAAAVVGAQP